MLLRRPRVDYYEAKFAMGANLFDQIVVPVVIRGEILVSLAKSHGDEQAVVSARLRVACDVLAEHFACALPRGPQRVRDNLPVEASGLGPEPGQPNRKNRNRDWGKDATNESVNGSDTEAGTSTLAV